MPNPFLDHPRSVGETYSEHFAVAGSVGTTMIAAGLACVVHAMLPFVFQRTASDCIVRLEKRFVLTSRGRSARTSDTGEDPESLLS
jgi:hypothetical protein